MAEDQETARQVVIEASIGFSEELRKRGYDDQSVQRWLELQIEGIRCLISEIEASGGGRDGNT